MTATTPSKRGFIRIPSMESLGFMDAPSRAWTTPPSHAPGSTQASSQVSALVPVPLGRHGKNGHPTGELVTDMWETTELHAPRWKTGPLKNLALNTWAAGAFAGRCSHFSSS